LAIVAVVLGLAHLSAPPAAQAAGGRQLWYANDSGWHHAYVQLLASSPHIAVYAEPGTVSLHDARMIADAASWRIFPTDIRTFGKPAGLSSVSVALLPLGGITLGYFNEDDVAPYRPGADASHSNHANILYVRTPNTMPDSTRLSDVGEVIAHELQHLIDFRIRVVSRGWLPEDDWLNEGLSVYAQFANHYFTERDALKVQAAAADPGWQLTDISSSNASVIEHARAAYGRAGLFVSYLVARFGPAIARDIIATRQTGTTAVAQVLARRHVSLTRIFTDWGIASLLNQPGKYGYGNLDVTISQPPATVGPTVPGSQLPYGYSRRLTMTSWTHQYLTLGSGPSGTLVVKLHSSCPQVGAAVVLERPGDAAASTVHWLQPDFSGSLVARLKNFGQFYTRAEVVLADASKGTAAGKVRLDVHLVHAIDDSRVSRRAPAARHHRARFSRHIPHTE
jgi:hypothetical protein